MFKTYISYNKPDLGLDVSKISWLDIICGVGIVENVFFPLFINNSNIYL